MSKKDRIAIVVSTLYFLFPLALFFGELSGAQSVSILLLIPLVIYWGTRFIRNNISFLEVNHNI